MTALSGPCHATVIQRSKCDITIGSSHDSHDIYSVSHRFAHVTQASGTGVFNNLLFSIIVIIDVIIIIFSVILIIVVVIVNIIIIIVVVVVVLEQRRG